MVFEVERLGETIHLNSSKSGCALESLNTVYIQEVLERVFTEHSFAPQRTVSSR